MAVHAGENSAVASVRSRMLQWQSARLTMQRRTTLTALTLLTTGLALGVSACELRLGDPFKVAPPDTCDVPSQNAFVVEVMSDFYLWNTDLPADIDLDAYDSPEQLVGDLRQGVDRWTRVSDKSTSDALFMEGKFIGFGYKTLRGPEDEVRLSFVNDNSPASAAGLLRGDRIVAVNGITAEQLDADDGWSAVYGENEPGIDIDLEIEHLATGELETVTLTKAWIDVVSIPVAKVLEGPSGAPVGYYIMDKFVETTKSELEGTYAMFKEMGVNTVIIDLRYNGGGLISVAERQVNLTVGADHAGEVAYTFQYNSNYSEENKSTKISELGWSLGSDKVLVLTSSRTLSASELVINALLPYADVTLIGSNTGGKPVGSKSFEFCDKLLFPITFRLVNASGNTDYFDGMQADCYAEDDIFHQLGDPEEGMLAAALAYAIDGTCASPPEMPYPAPLGVAAPWPDAVGEELLPNADEREDIDAW
jgi:carboxyl-terminal processing protease